MWFSRKTNANTKNVENERGEVINDFQLYMRTRGKE